MSFTCEQRRKLIEIYPYLKPRNVWNDEEITDYDYSWMNGEADLPKDWIRLFLMYVKEIRPYLDRNGLVNRYRFSQIKEKYNTMRMYDFGAPSHVHQLNTIYDCFARYVCQNCGELATLETQGYYASYCEECEKMFADDCQIEKLELPNFCVTERWNNGNTYETHYSYKSLYKRYLNIKDMTDEEFYNYMIN